MATQITNKKALRIVYAGTPDFSTPALQALRDGGYEVVAVYTQPDRRSGRGRKIAHSPVKTKALQLQLPVEQPVSLRDADAQRVLHDYNPDLMIVAAYGLLLPQAVLDMPRYGCINIHASLLPRWRGAAPIQRAIAAGDEESGVTIMQMDAGLDTGDMLFSRFCPIGENTTGVELHDQLAELGVQALVSVLESLCSTPMQPVSQNDRHATYAKKLDKSESIIDWNQSAVDIHRKICAFNAWPVAQTSLSGETLRVWQSRLLADITVANGSSAGQIVALTDGLDVATGSGVLRLTQLQAPGKKAISATDFLNSRDLSPGMRLGCSDESGSNQGG